MSGTPRNNRSNGCNVPLPSADTPRTIKPRRPSTTHRPIVALTDIAVLLEDGTLFAADELPRYLSTAPSSVLIVQGFGEHLQRLQRTFRSDPLFNFRVTPVSRYLSAPQDGRKRVQLESVSTVCNFVGWKSPRKQANRYHYPIDPLHFLTAARSLDDLDDSDEAPIFKLLKWGLQIREWCQCNGLQIKASAGGLAAQLLRDSRFYPEPRRKAPRLINDAVRCRLPGNYYRLFAPVNTPQKAVYLDMENAHHAMACRIRFPHVDTLHAYGDFSFTAREERGKASARPFAPGDSPILARPGLFYLRLYVPGGTPDKFPPPFLQNSGEVDRWVWSNELPLIQEHNARIVAVLAAYVSEASEVGLNSYAKWAIRELSRNPEFRNWLKPTLHATYGLLAARPIPFETGYLRAKGGERTEYLMGRYSIPVLATKRSVPIESRIANVIHRGMIEAEVRKEVLWYARYLTEVERRRVLSIYADSLFVTDNGREMGLMQPPWKVKAHLTGLRFHSAVHFTSPSLSRLPGVPRSAREAYLTQRELSRYLRGVRERSVRAGC